MLTRSGLGAVISAVLLGAAGIVWRYEELVVVAIGVAFLVVLAVLVARRALRSKVERRINTLRVPRGDPVRVTYRVRNDTAYRSGRATLIDRLGDDEMRVAIEPVAARDLETMSASIPTRRRGIFELGPLDIEKVDPFFLALGRWRQEQDPSVGRLVTVHPKVYDLAGAQGSQRVVENDSSIRRIAQDPMSGFVSMREYVAGDDPRLIHWPTTARTGTLMVREHVEVRRPEFTIVVDVASSVASDDDVEEIVDVAASLAIHALRTGLDVVTRTTSRAHPGHVRAIEDEAGVLELLTSVERTEDTMPIANLFTQGVDRTAVLIVTGPNGPSTRLGDDGSTVMIRVGEGAEPGPGIAFAAGDAPDFVRRWQTWS